MQQYLFSDDWEIELDTSWCLKSSTVIVKMPLIKCIPELIFNLPFKAFKNCDLLEIFFFSLGGGLWQTENQTYMGVSLKRKGKQGVREYILNGPIRYCYVLYHFDAALVVIFVDFVSLLLSSTIFFERTYNTWEVQ